jgi:E3 ubiquitin-protein ligase SHPRH
MVAHIPRVNALAVSGTPARSDVSDLVGSLRFLRVPVLSSDAHFWHRLHSPGMRASFEAVFQTLAVRTTKKQVSGEFHLPSQTRMVMPIDLSEIELHYYNNTLDRSREQLGLPLDVREARPDGWILDAALFRSCLRNLRQVCTHIQVGALQQPGNRAGRLGQRLNLGRELMTMEEALKKMREDHMQAVILDTRNQVRR